LWTDGTFLTADGKAAQNRGPPISVFQFMFSRHPMTTAIQTSTSATISKPGPLSGLTMAKVIFAPCLNLALRSTSHFFHGRRLCG